MLKDLQENRIPITLGGTDMYLRYNLTAMRYLEEYYGNKIDQFMMKDSDKWSTGDVLHLLRAGLIDYYFADNEKLIDNQDYKHVYPSLASLGRIVTVDNSKEIALQIVQALIDSLPPAPVGTVKNFPQGGRKQITQI